MRLQIRSVGLDPSESLHAYAARRVVAALEHLLRGAVRVNLQISDDNGPKGGIDKRCTIIVHGGGPVAHVEAIAADPYAAVDGASDRILQVLQRRVSRSRRRDRRRAQAQATRGAREVGSWP